MKVKNFELTYVINNFNRIKFIKDRKFIIPANRAINQMKETIRIIETLMDESDDYKEYKEEVQKLRDKYVSKDESNVIITKEFGEGENKEKRPIYTDENIKKLNDDIEKLNNKYVKVLDEFKKGYKEYIKALNSDSDYVQPIMEEVNIPKDIDLEQLQLISIIFDIQYK